MADDQTSNATPQDTTGTVQTPAVEPSPAPEGVFHHIARVFGIDPDATVTAAKAFYKDPVQAAKEVVSQIPATTKASAKASAKDIAGNITDPEQRLKFVTGMVQSSSEFGPEGGELEGGLKDAAKSIADKLHEHFKKTTSAGVPDEASTFTSSKAEPEPAPAPITPEHLTVHSRAVAKNLQDLGYTNQQITNFNIDEIHQIITGKVPAAEWKGTTPHPEAEPAEPISAAVSAEPKVSATAETPAATEKTQDATLPDHITFDELDGQEVKAPDLNPPQRPGAFRTPIEPSPAERADRIEDLKSLTNSPNTIEAKNAKELLKTVYGVTGSEISPVVQSTTEWKPPAGLKEGIPSTAPVDTQIPLEKISVSPRQYSAASSDIARGAGSHTTEPIRILHNPDNGQFLVEDGMHRLVEAHQRGETTIPAKLWSGYSDTVANVHGDQMDLSPNEPETEEGQEPPAPQFDQTLARRGQMPGQTVNLADAYGDTGHYVGGLIQHRLAVNPENGNLEPQEQYIQRLGTTTGSDLMSIPQSRLIEGSTTHDVISHELGHAVMAHLMGLPTDGMEVWSHQHPDAGRGAAAATSLPMDQMAGATVNPLTGAVRFTPEALVAHWPKLLNTWLAGGVTQELAHGIPFEMNEGTNGDFHQIHQVGKIMGFTPSEVDDMVNAHLAETRDLLGHPGTLDAIRQAAGEREEGLSKALHVSADKVQDVIQKVTEARNGKNGYVSSSRGDNGALAAETEPRKAGATAQGTVREDNGEAVSANAQSQAVTPAAATKDWADRYKLATDAQGNRVLYHAVPPENAQAVQTGGLRKGSKLSDNPNDARFFAARDREGVTPERTTVHEVHLPHDAFHGAGPFAVTDRAVSPQEMKIHSAPERQYHPDLQKVLDITGPLHTDPAKIKDGPAFITPDGRISNLPAGRQHPEVIQQATGETRTANTADNRSDFLDRTGAVRTRFFQSRAGDALAVSVPSTGVTPEQLDTIQQAVGKAGRNTNLSIERSDISRDHPERAASKEFARPSDVDDLLRQIGAHPDQAIAPKAESNKTPDESGYVAPTADAFFMFASPEEHASQAGGFKPGEWNISESDKVKPNVTLQASAQKYAQAHDMAEINHTPVKADEARATELANIYDAAKHDPNNPRVKAAYDALKSETLAQFHHLRDDLGLKFKPQTEDPYLSAGDMMTDIKKNNQLKVFSGSGPGADHPLSATEPTTGETYNTLFRWVHDAMGHAAGGNDFSENGEKSATEAHAQMYSDAARPAMRAETEGQTSWFFHNPEVQAGRAKPGAFAAQKATILPDVSHDWHETAGKMASTNDAGGINPRTGKTDSKGLGVEVLPELRQPLDHTPTAKDFSKFYDANKAIFDRYPALRVGWDNNSGEKGGHEINIGAVGAGAPAVARKLDQIAAFDIGKGANIPTDGTGKTRSFPNYSFAQRMKDLEGHEVSPTLESNKSAKASPVVSTRVPWGKVKGVDVEDHSDQSRTSDMDAARNAPGYVEKMVNRVKDVPGFISPEGADANATADAYIRHVADNIKFVNGKLTPAEIARDSQWYPVGAHNRVLDVAKQHGFTPTQIAGVTAVESPMTDWDQNTSLAERTANIWRNQQNTKFTPEMQEAADRITDIPANRKFKTVYKSLRGKTLGELPTVEEQAHWLRLYDEGHNPRDYETWNPDGTTNGLAQNMDGTNKKVGWSFQNHIQKAISILKDGSPENISAQLGYGHKVRNFYNNMISPDDPRYLTIDTHAVNVGQLRPMSGKNTDVATNFGKISNGKSGLSGTYPLHDAAYRLAAKELDIPIPSRLQSPTWSKIREVFPDDFKTKENLDAVDSIWKEHSDGKITADQARQRVWDYASGWNAGAAQKARNSSDQGKLFEAGVRGPDAGGAAGPGDRGTVAPGTSDAAVNDDEGDTSFNFGANAAESEPEEAPIPRTFSQPRASGKVKGAMSALDLINALKGLKKPAK